MNILIVVQRFSPAIGGSEIFTKNLADYLSNNHKVTVFTTTAKEIHSFWKKTSENIENSSEFNYSVKRFKFLTPLDIKMDENSKFFPFITSFPGPFSPSLWEELVTKKINFDLIITTAFPFDHILPAFVAAKKWKIPLAIIPLIHQEIPELYLTSLKLTILKNSDAIFVLSESEKKILTKNEIEKNKISIIIPYVEKKLSSIKPIVFKKNYSIKNSDKLVLFVGSKSYVKGIIHLIESMKIIWKKNHNVKLIIIGPNSKDFEDYFSKLPSSVVEKIIDLGIVEEEIKNVALESCEILAIPSKSESFGLVYKEAWLKAKPVIGCNIEPISEIIEHKKNGLLVNFGDINELANTINYLLENPLICKKLGQSGKTKVEQNNSLDNYKLFEKKLISLVREFKNM